MAIPLEEKLRKRGWSEDEIKHASKIMGGSKEPGKIPQQQTIHPFLYWMGLILAIVGNMLVAVVLIPLILVLTSTVMYIIIGVLGLGFGGMFYLLLTDLERVSPRSHIIAGVFIPAIALITIYIMVDVVNYIGRIINLEVSHSPIIISLVYVITFTLPYAYSKINEYMYRKKQTAHSA